MFWLRSKKKMIFNYTLLEACCHENKYIGPKPGAPYDPLNIETEAILIRHKISL